MCQADGSLAILEVEGNSLAGKAQWVQPKSKSQAVSMVLLAADGSPLYSKDAHLQLTWPHNNMMSSMPQGKLSGDCISCTSGDCDGHMGTTVVFGLSTRCFVGKQSCSVAMYSSLVLTMMQPLLLVMLACTPSACSYSRAHC